MKAKVIKVVEKPSKYGKTFYYLFLKNEQGQSFRSCLFPACNNFSRWEKVVKDCKAGKEVFLDRLAILNKSFVDADSQFCYSEPFSIVAERKGI